MFSLFAFIAFLCRDFLQVVLDKSQLLGSFRQRSAEKVQEVAIGSEHDYHQKKYYDRSVDRLLSVHCPIIKETGFSTFQPRMIDIP